jgi:hypothetical protein
MVLRWALVALDAAVDSEAGSTEAVAASEVVVVVLAVAAASIVEVADVSATVDTVHPTEHPQVLAAADLVVAVTAVVDSMIAAHAATLTLSLCLLVEATVEEIAAEIVEETVTAIATVTALVGMLDKSDLTTVVGMTTQDRDAATEWPSLDT